MSNRLQKEVQVKPNGVKTIKLYNKTNETIGRKFKCKQNNLFIVENPTNTNERRFTISIRNDGRNELEGKYKIAQLSFLAVEDLLNIRNSIDELLLNSFKPDKDSEVQKLGITDEGVKLLLKNNAIHVK